MLGAIAAVALASPLPAPEQGPAGPQPRQPLGAPADGLLRVFVEGAGRVEVSRGHPQPCAWQPTTACEVQQPVGTTVTLVARPAEGGRFTGWSVAGCAGLDPCRIVLEKGRVDLVAAFSPLEVKVEAAGEGTVTTGPDGPTLVCTDPAAPPDQGAQAASEAEEEDAKVTTCTTQVEREKAVTLIATPAESGAEVRWSSACRTIVSEPEHRCTLVANRHRLQVGVGFAGVEPTEQGPSKKTVTPIVRVRGGKAAGTITGPGIDCGDDCIAEPLTIGGPAGEIRLAATPAPGFTFREWRAPTTTACTTNPCVFPASSDITLIEAVFDKLVRINLIGSGEGIVLGRDFACAEDCVLSFAVGARIGLAAEPDSGSRFAGWTPRCGDPCVLAVDEVSTVVARFDGPSHPRSLPWSLGSAKALGTGSRRRVRVVVVLADGEEPAPVRLRLVIDGNRRRPAAVRSATADPGKTTIELRVSRTAPPGRYVLIASLKGRPERLAARLWLRR